ncbi:MAG: TolC family protein [Phaeodactylibacter sp.]|uniref:TolC family protein n=1 Tax=Phaeodactylibacter sp. TaxID=1940289 RepID=UPI0032EE0D1F
MVLKFIPTLLVLVLFSSVATGQPADSAQVLTAEQYLSWVANYHPVARQGRLLNVQAEALERLARGGFDPKLYGDWDQKNFKESEYFAFGEAGVKIPTWYGIELKGAYTVADVDALYQNAERTLPEMGQAVLGIKVPLGRNLIIDDRRAALEQAKIMANANEAQQQGMVNDLLLESAKIYWDWSVAFNQLMVFDRALVITEERFEGIRQSFFAGDLPAMDTLETMIQVQNRQFDYNNALIAYRNATLQLSNFLWTEAGEPLEVTNELRPLLLEDLEPDPVPNTRQQLWQEARQMHPDLLQYRYKLQQYDVDRRLALEQLKPRLDVEYNFLGEGTNFLPGTTTDNGITQLVGQNYKWGVRFDFPVFLRKERGKLQLTRIKIQDAEYTLQRKQLEVENKINNYYNEQDNFIAQIELYEGAVQNYNTLLEAEYIKFDLGESSIFLVNSREQKLIDAQLKLTELRGKFFKTRQKLEWAAGRLGLMAN